MRVIWTLAFSFFNFLLSFHFTQEYTDERSVILMEMMFSWVVDEERLEEDSSDIDMCVLEHVGGLWVGH